jgi:hypothetical protein
MRSLLVAIFTCLLCAGIAAQTKIYKVRLPDGRILFTDQPPPGAQVISETDAPAPSPEPPPASAAKRDSQAGTLQQRAARTDEQLRDKSAQIDKAFADVQTAERELQGAKQQLEQGRAPLPGEMLGTARGGVRAGPAYQERIAKLEQAVVAAEQKLAKAREELNAVR